MLKHKETGAEAKSSLVRCTGVAAGALSLDLWLICDVGTEALSRPLASLSNRCSRLVVACSEGRHRRGDVGSAGGARAVCRACATRMLSSVMALLVVCRKQAPLMAYEAL